MAVTPPPKRSHQSPSYARDTVASTSRKTTREAPPSPLTTSTPSPLRREVFRSYTLSTAASRSKARWHGPFRFLDLPAELRNRVYEFCRIEKGSRHIDLADASISDAKLLLRSLPRLLQVNKQVMHEAGSYFFTSDGFDILIHESRLQLFANWLKLIGRANCQRLANQITTIRLAHNRDVCGPRCVATDVTHPAFGIGAESAAQITSLSDAYESITPPVRWIFTAKCQGGVDSWRGAVLWPERLSTRANHPFSKRFFTKVKTALGAVFSALEGTDVLLEEDQDTEKWLHWSGSPLSSVGP